MFSSWLKCAQCNSAINANCLNYGKYYYYIIDMLINSHPDTYIINTHTYNT